jgi:hypothetical protein
MAQLPPLVGGNLRRALLGPIVGEDAAARIMRSEHGERWGC